ncbi:MAG: hypothetical protein IJX94_01030 [Clostridia bacterium]|nr:hypothetical protein [Clostridia bacterium]
MKFLSDYFNSGSVRQQNKKRLAALAVCATAALLAVALIALMIGSIATAIKNKAPDGTESGDETGTKIPTGYTTANLAEAGYSVNAGTLLVIDDTHPYAAATATVQPQPNLRAKDTETNTDLYRGDYDMINITQETLDAFNAMVIAFHTEQKDQADYKTGNLWLQGRVSAKEYSSAADAALKSATGLIICQQEKGTENDETSIYDSTAKKGVGVYQWIYENAYKYGFVQASTAEGEENVFRYVGVAHAAYMKNNNKTFSDYLALFQTNKPTASRPLTVSVKDAKGNTVKYNMYYLSSTEEAVVPTKYNYTVSGDNMGGYIVTVDTSSAATTK